MEEDPDGEQRESERERQGDLTEREPEQPLELLKDQVGSDSGGSLVPLPESLGEVREPQVLVPTGSEMELMLAKAVDGDSLADLAKATAALVAVAKRQASLKRRLFGIAAFDLKVKRKLGLLLMQVECRGGDRAKCHRATLPNGGRPKDLNGSAAKRCRRLAEIDEVIFQHYLEDARDRSGRPSEAGALRFAKSGSEAVPRKPRTKRKAKGGDVEVSPDVLDAISRCLGDIDVCVGDAEVECRIRVAGSKLQPKHLDGVVFVSANVESATLLEEVSGARSRAQCSQAVLLLPMETCASWLGSMSAQNWHVCFLDEGNAHVAVAYLGKRTEAFHVCMHEHGVVMSVRNHCG